MGKLMENARKAQQQVQQEAMQVQAEMAVTEFEGFDEDEMKEFSNVVRFLPKPFEMNDLLEAVRAHALR